MPSYDTAILVGSFEPYLLADRAAIQHALAHANRVVVLVGAAATAQTVRHPWTAEERIAMIRGDLSPEDNARVELHPVRDHLYRPQRWLCEVQRTVLAIGGGLAIDAALDSGTGLDRSDGPNALGCRAGQARIAQVLHPGQAPIFSDWIALPVEQARRIDLFDLRKMLFGSDRSLDEMAQVAPPSTLSKLNAWRATASFSKLQNEYRHLEAFRKSWEPAPYPPIFVTTDAVVLHGGRILLVQRAREPGKGLWALPGGFVEQDERLLASCLRELREETGLELPAHEARCALRRQHVFDAPDRSLRGRTITHAFRFDLEGDKARPVKGGDDASAAHWIALARFFEMESEIFEDHFHIASYLLED
ncbi:MAG TPA: NUDIX domain-containing protein [Burkholderiales bacterium]|nr:NUDIX domain-containing protein [Burkholderiales bacterium]